MITTRAVPALLPHITGVSPGPTSPLNDFADPLAVVQALHYRLSLLNELHSLQSQSPILEVHDPTVFVLIGDAEQESLSGAKRRSFELFRRTLKGVEILTYDELFNGLANQAVWMEPTS